MKHTLNISRASIAVFVVLLVVGMTIPLGTVAQSQEEDEPNDAQEAATTIEGTSISGEITQQGDSDWFATEFNAGETASFAVTKSIRKDGLQIRLYAPNGTEINKTTGYHGVGKLEVAAPIDESGQYYVEIQAVDESDTNIPYTAYAPAEEAPSKKQPQNPVAGEQKESEPNNANQSNIIEGEEISGTVSSKNDSDWYAFYATKGQSISMLFTKSSESTDLVYRVYQPNQEHVYSYDRMEDQDGRQQLVIGIERTGIHFLEVASGSADVHESGDKYTVRFTGESLPLQFGPSSRSNTDSSGSNNSTTDSDDTSQSTGTQADDELTSLFGPGFTGAGAVVALFMTALFALRRR